MINIGSIGIVDSTYTARFQGTLTQTTVLNIVDNAYNCPMFGFVLADSTRFLPDSTFFQGAILGSTDSISYTDGINLPTTQPPNFDPTSFWATPDPPLYLTDTTYAGGRLVDGTYMDGTWMHRWYDPVWINYSLWYTQDRSNNQLIGYRYREPARKDVGNYYTLMQVPRQTGQYEIRWRYLKEHGTYAHEVVQGFLCKSQGIDSDRS